METTKTSEAGVKGRRRFLKTAGLAGAAAVAAPAVVRAQAPVKLKFQSTWPNKDIFHEFAADFVKRVNEMGGGRIELELLAAGAVVPAFQLIDAVHAGVLDGGHGVSAYWYGKNKAFSLFGTAPAFGWRAEQYLAWMRYGGGQALYEELINDVMKLNVVGMQYGPMPTQPLGWFKKELTTAADLRGLKYRTVGLAADLNRELGVAVTILAGGEIVPAIDRGLIDGAEFNNPSSDLLLGFPDVSKLYYIQSYHQALESFEILFNKGKFNALPKEVQAIIRAASDASSSDMSWKATDRYSKDIEAIKARGVKVMKTPEPILKAQLEAWKTTIQKLSADPFFKKVVDSQMAWAKRTVAFQLDYEVDQRMAYNSFFGAS
jgi:TRAP-type mannitol/chloroaromatic compound transport system substrate-binding protein